MERTRPSQARSRKKIEDITEQEPIPRGQTVGIEDVDTLAGIWFVEWRGRIYMATEDELRF